MDVPSLWRELEGTLTPMLAGFRAKRSLHVEQKPDATLLSEADEAVQAEIIRCLRAADPDGLIIGEEAAHGADALPGRGLSGRAWIIDPIDGTAQFVQREGREYCSVVCLVEDRRPVAAFVLAPEIGHDRTSVCVSVSGADEAIEINGKHVSAGVMTGQARAVSVTRSSGTQPRAYEAELLANGYELKTRTTSQTLDMVRTCVDLSPYTDPELGPFGLFYRENQKLWDGAAGMCLAYAAGLHVGNGAGKARTEIEIALDASDPVFSSTLVASDPVAMQIVVNGSIHS